MLRKKGSYRKEAGYICSGKARRLSLTRLESWHYFFPSTIHVRMNVFPVRLDWLFNHDFTDSDLLNRDWLNCQLARFVQVLNIKIVNDLLSVHKFVVVSVVSIEIIVIVISFDSILKSSSISMKIQYIIDFSLVFIVYHYWIWEFILLIRQKVINDRAKQIRMKYIMNMHRLW